VAKPHSLAVNCPITLAESRKVSKIGPDSYRALSNFLLISEVILVY
jgi:hypothetical protein